MSDFLDRLGEQLVAAECALAPRRRRRWRRGRLAAGMGAALVVAVPALAETQPWQLEFGRPELHDTPTGRGTTAVPVSQADVLGVLRRPQDERDLGATAQRLIRSVGSEFQGVRASSVRVVTSPSGHTVAIVSAERIGDPATRETDQANPLCVTSGHGGLCGTTQSLMAGHLAAFDGPHIFGLVPDGVATVVYRYQDGSSVRGAVADNFFWIDNAPVTTRKEPSDARVGITTPPSTIEWLNAGGKIIGPNHRP
jgi:hypothetical protein